MGWPECEEPMRVLFDIAHPAHVHFFKNIIWELHKGGHETAIGR